MTARYSHPSAVGIAVFSWHLPGIPMFLLFLLGAFPGGLLLYIFSTRSVRHDAREIKRLNARVKELRAQIEEREKLQMRSPSGALPTNFAPPAVPVPGFSPSGALGPSGPLGQRQAVKPPGLLNLHNPGNRNGARIPAGSGKSVSDIQSGWVRPLA